MEALALLARHPRERLWRWWNWKAAVERRHPRHAVLRRQPHDLRRMPRLIVEFVMAIVNVVATPYRRRWIL